MVPFKLLPPRDLLKRGSRRYRRSGEKVKCDEYYIHAAGSHHTRNVSLHQAKNMAHVSVTLLLWLQRVVISTAVIMKRIEKLVDLLHPVLVEHFLYHW
jgi:hypothetical protein